jgi:hypothetical protein
MFKLYMKLKLFSSKWEIRSIARTDIACTQVRARTQVAYQVSLSFSKLF